MNFQNLSGLLSLSLFINFLTSCLSANILFYAALSTYSHRIAMWPLAVELAEKGHSVTFLQPGKNKNPHPKIKEVYPKDDVAGIGSLDLLSFRLNYGPVGIGNLNLMGALPSLGVAICQSLLEEKNILDWINSSSFDLVIIDALYNDCAYGLAFKWRAKTAIFGTSAAYEFWADSFGYSMDTNWIPNMHYEFAMPMPFYGRVISTLLGLWYRHNIVQGMHPQLEPALRNKLNIPDMPDIVQLEKNTSLVLMNSHFSEELARSLPPLVIPIGGMHYENKTAPLPKDIANFIGNEPFVYVSFGSGAQISKAPIELQEKIFNAFRNAKIKVLWKWEANRPAKMSSNVYTAKWLPQQSLLAHPNIKAFITHGGMLSIQESLINAVPMIIFPIFAEQGYNAERVHRKKRGIQLEITAFTQQELEDAINTIVTDKIYSETTKRDSILFQDRPQKPLDTAVWWVEYVLRHDDLSHLRPLSIHQTWYQKRLLDVWLFVLGTLLIVIYLTVLIIKKILGLCFGSSKGKKLKTN